MVSMGLRGVHVAASYCASYQMTYHRIITMMLEGRLGVIRRDITSAYHSVSDVSRVFFERFLHCDRSGGHAKGFRHKELKKIIL